MRSVACVSTGLEALARFNACRSAREGSKRLFGLRVGLAGALEYPLWQRRRPERRGLRGTWRGRGWRGELELVR